MNQLLTVSRKTELKPYKARQFIPWQEMTDADIFNSSGDLIFDTECFPNFFLAAFKHTSGRIIRLVPPFDPRKLSYILHHYRCIGFNSLKYDIPLLWAAYKAQIDDLPLSWLKEISNKLIYGDWWQNVCKEYGIQVFTTDHIDLIEVCPGNNSLKLYGARLHTKRIQELPFHHMTELNEEQKEIVTDYCINNDLEATEVLFNHNKDRLELRSYLGIRYNSNLMSKSDAQMAEAIMIEEIKKKTGRRIKRPENVEWGFSYQPPSYLRFASSEFKNLFDKVLSAKFEDSGFGSAVGLEKTKIELGSFKGTFGVGGFHSSEQSISYKADDEYLIVDKDVASYYPKIISNLRLYPEHLGPVFLEVFDELTERRLIAKKNKQFAEDKGLKIAINGISGKLNQEFSTLFSPKCYYTMTLTGQLSVLMLIEILHYNGIQTISANTDGIVLYCKKSDYEKLEYWIKFWENETRYQTEETQYKCYYGRDVNAYFALKMDNSVKVKGPYSEVGSQTGTALDNNPIMLICSDAIKKLLSDNVPIEKTIRECSDIRRFVTVRNVKGGAHKNGDYLGKVVRWAYFKKEYGTINYVESGNKVPETEGARPLMDLPESFPDDIDYDRYINETTNILYDIDYLKRPKQVSFF